MKTQDDFKQRLANFKHFAQSLKANIKHGFPAKSLKIIGVTGTDGKTTTTSMIYHVLISNGINTGYISTINAKIGDEELDTGLHVTTPDPWMVPKYLKMMKDKGITHVVLESTSQGLQQNRLFGVSFDSVVITNIKSDHLDYHGSWENYAKSKFRIIEKLLPNGLAALNKDDTKSAAWLNTRLSSTNLSKERDIQWYSKEQLSNISHTVSGIKFTFSGVNFELPIIGEHNFENALAAIYVTRRYLPLEKVVKALQTFKAPKGRMELIQSEPFSVIIDFAHTPHALERALESLIVLKKPSSRIITVFGCAGKRDKARREMGAVSARYADISILTAEDPRDEKLASINSEIFAHAKNSKLISRIANHEQYLRFDKTKAVNEIASVLPNGQKAFIAFDEDTVASREDAIDFAINIAKPDDIVFITGKAHEQSLCFGETEIPWSDHEVVNSALQSR